MLRQIRLPGAASRRWASTAAQREPLVPKETLRAIVNSFHAPIRFAFAYGSAVYPQARDPQKPAEKKPQVDLVFGVTHPQHWHSLNLRQHPEHYSALGRLGARTVAHVQQQYGAGVYYNPYVRVEAAPGLDLKYGVVAVDTLCADLEQWETLYLAGRLQKPVAVVRDSARVRLANQSNLAHAVAAALLALPARFSEEEFYVALCRLSYAGDVRFAVRGEDPQKVFSIVSMQTAQFRELYMPLADALPNVAVVRDGMLEQDMHPRLRTALLARLPASFVARMRSHHAWYLSRMNLSTDRAYAVPPSASPGEVDVEAARRREAAILASMVASPELPLYVQHALVDTVWWPSLAQAAKGVLSAGVVRAARYGAAKLSKGWGV